MRKEEPLYVQISNDLRDKILQGVFRPGDRLPSENEIAEQYHVSVITSKRVLNDLTDEGLIFRLKGRGSFVAGNNGQDILNSKRTNFKGVVGVIFPSISMPVESELLYYIQSRMHELRYQTLIRVTDDLIEKETEAIAMFRVFGVRGFVIFPAIKEQYNEEILRLSLERFPHVLVDRHMPNIRSSNVGSANRQAMITAVDYLLERGIRNVALITQSDTNSNTHARLLGFEEAFTRRGYPIDKTKWMIEKAGQSDEDFKQDLMKFFQDHPSLAAVVAIDTPLASLSYAALNEIGRKIPEDVTLISFDDPKLPFVPYIRQDTATIAQRAVDILLAQMESDYVVMREEIPVQFVTEVRYPTPFGLL